jgi:recombination associated protein RdgC
MRFMTEAKVLPASVLNRKVNEKAEHIEKTEGRKPGKKEKRELKDEAKLDLLPMAFTKQHVGLDRPAGPHPGARYQRPGPRRRGGDAAGRRPARLCPGPAGHPDQPTGRHGALADDAGAARRLHRRPRDGAESRDESKAVVRYARHPLDIDEVRKHIEHGKLPTKLAMTWDDRVSFVLTEGLQIKNITLLDAVMDGNSKDDSGFDTDVAIATGELSRLIPDLIEALGGEGRTRLGDLPASLQKRRQRKLCQQDCAPARPHREASAHGPDRLCRGH